MTVALPPRTFDHDAFVHDSDEDYAAALAPLLQGAASHGDATAAVVSKGKAGLLAAALGSAAAKVNFVDAEAWYRHPVSTIAAYESLLRRTPSGVRTVLIGEVQFGSEPADWTSWTRYEALLNSSLARYDAHVVCPYDRRTLPGSVVEDALRTHPWVLDGLGRHASDNYDEPDFLVASLPPSVEVPSREPDLELSLARSLRHARHEFARLATASGFDSERVDELTLAVNEIATNAIVHGGIPSLLQVWQEPGGLTCVVSDRGKGADPLAGFQSPPRGSTSGYGLWLTRTIFDRADALADDDGFRIVLFASRTRAPS